MIKIGRETILIMAALTSLTIKTKGARGASDEQIEQLQHFAKQGVKVRLK